MRVPASANRTGFFRSSGQVSRRLDSRQRSQKTFAKVFKMCVFTGANYVSMHSYIWLLQKMHANIFRGSHACMWCLCALREFRSLCQGSVRRYWNRL